MRQPGVQNHCCLNETLPSVKKYHDVKVLHRLPPVASVSAPWSSRKSTVPWLSVFGKSLFAGKPRTRQMESHGKDPVNAYAQQGLLKNFFNSYSPSRNREYLQKPEPSDTTPGAIDRGMSG